MRIVKIGNISSEQELKDVVQSSRGDRVLDATELLTSIARIEKHGFSEEQKRWRSAPNDPSVKIYVADSSLAANETTVWAAIDLGADERSVTLLKIVDTYTGGNHESDGLLGDAIHRKANGQIQ